MVNVFIDRKLIYKIIVRKRTVNNKYYMIIILTTSIINQNDFNSCQTFFKARDRSSWPCT